MDVESLGLTDYYDVIKTPMDLSTIKKKMDARLYANPQEFREDIILMCENCFKYNPPDQIVHLLGKQLLVYKKIPKI